MSLLIKPHTHSILTLGIANKIINKTAIAILSAEKTSLAI